MQRYFDHKWGQSFDSKIESALNVSAEVIFLMMYLTPFPVRGALAAFLSKTSYVVLLFILPSLC